MPQIDLLTDDYRSVRFGLVPIGTRLRNESGLYAVYAGNSLLYIGRADDLDARIGSCFMQHEKAFAFNLMGADLVGFAPIGNSLLRDQLEAALIRGNRPPLNDQHNPSGPNGLWQYLR